ncbi:chorismate--pyruvate lyase family protein [Microbulbifer sp. JMSA004]|uniref:chorismate--pyruvate lyase family protein n=1 Tax=unclassified Microbulbifer TaxID=2619833 RepID=UPI0024ADF8AF|nr:chorismate lyase [Microbulbifer sp. VAAF005]WHI44909.1 chorismate lyase [Microbulbifer sp. VAAF005]
MHQSPFVPSGDWQSLPLDTQQQPPNTLVPWLTYSDSLTAALKQQSGGDFYVRVLYQGWQPPRPEEVRALGLNPSSRALIREVLLYGCGQPWVYARSVLPERSLQGKSRNLRSLDARPLGELLFSEPGIRRGEITLNLLQKSPGCADRELGDKDFEVWGRRSVFWLRDKPLLVAEAFLPNFKPTGDPIPQEAAQTIATEDSL